MEFFTPASASSPSMAVSSAPCDSQRSQYPIVTGTSVIALKYKDGVMMVADTLGSYGSLARFRDMKRLVKVGEQTLLGAGGEYSDFDYIQRLLDDRVREDYCADDGSTMTAKDIHNYLIRVMYNRRNKMNPLWNNLVIGGLKDGEPYLGTVDLIGTSFTEDYIATGYGMHLALPLIRKEWRADLSEAEARTLLEKAMRVCLYRDCRTLNKMNLAKATKEGVVVSPAYSLETKWDFKTFIDPKAGVENGGSW